MINNSLTRSSGITTCFIDKILVSVVGSTHNNTSLSNNLVVTGNYIHIQSDGGSTGTVSAVFTIEITY